MKLTDAINSVKNLIEEKRLQKIRKGIDTINSEKIEKLAEGMSEGNRLEAIKVGLEKLTGADIRRLTIGMSEENILESIKVGLEKLTGVDIRELTIGMSEENNILESIKVGLEKLTGADIYVLASRMSEENRLEAIRIGLEKLEGYHLGLLAERMNEKNLDDVIKLCVNKDGIKPLRLLDLARGNFIRVIEICLSMDKTEHLEGLIDSISEYNKVKAIEVCYEKLDGEYIEKITKGMTEKNRLKIKKMQLGLNELEGEEVIDIAKSLRKKIGLKEVVRGSVEGIADGMDEDNRLKVIELEFTKDHSYIDIQRMTEGMSSKNKLKVIEIGVKGERLYGYSIVSLAKDLSKEERKVVIKKYARELGDGIVNLVEEMDPKDKLWAIEVGVKGGTLYSDSIVSLAKDLSKEERKVVIKKYARELGAGIVDLVEEMDPKDKLWAIEVGVKGGNLYSGSIVSLAKDLSKEERKEVIEKYARELGDGIINLVEGMDSKDKLWAIEIGVKYLSQQNIEKLAEGIDKASVLKVVLENDKEKFKNIAINWNIYYIPEIGEALIDCINGNPLSERIGELFKTGKIGIKTASQITTENELKFSEIYGDLYDADRTGINTIPTEKVEQLNKKHIRTFMKLLEAKGVDTGRSMAIALNMYCTVGFNRGKEILEGKYGEIGSGDVLERVFKNINLSEFLLDSQGMPQVNEEFLNLAFGQNYKVNEEASPFKFYLKGGILDEKRQDINKFFDNFGVVYSEWDRINEEIDRKKAISKIEVKRNIESVVDVLGIINVQEFVPETLTDYKLAKTDITQYAGKDTQYTVNPEKALDRARYLSQLQDECKTKKFPNVRVENRDEQIVCTTYNPQDRGIMTAGYKSGCCFRPNGNADGMGNDNTSLMKYCLTSEYAGGIRVEVPNEKTGELELVMFSPILRNGNMLMIHSVETKETSPEIMKKINEILEQYANEVLRQSKDQEGKDGIQAVLITDLHSSRFDTSKSRGMLSERFTLHSDAPSGMYTNLGGTTHHVLAKNEGIIEKDLHIGDVEYSYEFPEMNEKNMMAYSKEECEFIREYEKRNKEIIRLANERMQFQDEGRTAEVDKCKVAIRSLQKEKEKLRKKCKNGIIALDNHRKQKIFMNNVLKQTTKDGDNHLTVGEDVFSRIIIGEGYFIAVTDNEEIVVESTNNAKVLMENDLEKLKDFLGGDKVKVLIYSEYMKNKEQENERENGNSVHTLAYEGSGSYAH